MENFWESLLQSVAWALSMGVVGILLAALGFKVFDWLCPHLDFEKELSEKQNVAVAILVAAFVIGVCAIVAMAVRPG